ncbi:MAG: hypothetical protein ACIAQU_03245 [Phycisphaerales bacterium JB064]
MEPNPLHADTPERARERLAALVEARRALLEVTAAINGSPPGGCELADDLDAPLVRVRAAHASCGSWLDPADPCPPALAATAEAMAVLIDDLVARERRGLGACGYDAARQRAERIAADLAWTDEWDEEAYLLAFFWARRGDA